MILTASSYHSANVQFPMDAQYRGRKVECVAWDEDTNCWVATDGEQLHPEELLAVSPPFDSEDGYYELDVPLRATSFDGTSVRIIGWVACDGTWEDGAGKKFRIIDCPVPEVRSRYRSLDANWYS